MVGGEARAGVEEATAQADAGEVMERAGEVEAMDRAGVAEAMDRAGVDEAMVSHSARSSERVPSHNRDNVPTERRIRLTDLAISFD